RSARRTACSSALAIVGIGGARTGTSAARWRRKAVTRSVAADCHGDCRSIPLPARGDREGAVEEFRDRLAFPPPVTSMALAVGATVSSTGGDECLDHTRSYQPGEGMPAP